MFRRIPGHSIYILFSGGKDGAEHYSNLPAQAGNMQYSNLLAGNMSSTSAVKNIEPKTPLNIYNGEFCSKVLHLRYVKESRMRLLVFIILLFLI